MSVKLDRYVGSCNTIKDLSDKARIPNKREDLNLSVFNIITGRNDPETLTKRHHVNVNVNLMEQNVIHINGGITINVDVNVKKHHMCGNVMFDYVWSPGTWNC